MYVRAYREMLKQMPSNMKLERTIRLGDVRHFRFVATKDGNGYRCGEIVEIPLRRKARAR